MELRPACENASRSATQEFTNNLWSPKIYYHFHKSLLLVPIQSQNNLLHNIQSYFSKYHFNIIPIYVLAFLIVYILLAFPPKS
jgi:hypothetical protein